MANCSNRLSFGIIGAGEIVARSHLPVLLNTEGIKIQWVADADFERANRLARANSLRAIKLPDALDDLPETDVVLLAIPYGARPPYFEVLRGRRTAVYVEKPFARTTDEHRAHCMGFEPYAVAIGYQRRCWYPVAVLKELTASDVFGALQSCTYSWGGPVGSYVSSGFVANARLAGGGFLMEHGVHGLDLLLYCSDAVAIEAATTTALLDNGLDIQVRGSFSIRLPDGRVVPAKVTIGCIEESREGLVFEFEHADVSLSLGSPKLNVMPKRRLGSIPYVIAREKQYPITPYQILHLYWETFIQGVRHKAMNITSAGSSLPTTAMVEAFYLDGVILKTRDVGVG